MHEVRFFQRLLATAEPSHRELIEKLRPVPTYMVCCYCQDDAYVRLNRDSWQNARAYCRQHALLGLDRLQECIDRDEYVGTVEYPVVCQKCGRPETRLSDGTIYDNELIGWGWPCVACIDGSEDLGPGQGVTVRTLSKSLARLLFCRFQGDDVPDPDKYRRACQIIGDSLMMNPSGVMELTEIIGREEVVSA